ncbi:subtilisin-like protease SBT3.18 isoform X6 [Aegilops tauschii subsp. strangulata]|uniref:Subtilisin-like protease n=2 Tax=Aegilops tauschii subsp. strangulata TaxID=200361 RepID=A0A453ITH3_AEGTS|nr:subtilisin-like protease SBT3.18 isoform X5 [Aegilops tauschii subsp. strangulata]
MAALLLLLLVSSLSFAAIDPVQCTAASHSHVHIVYLGHNNGLTPSLTTQFHLQLLSRVFAEPEEARQAILYSYSYGFSGFSAVLNSTQATTLSETEEVISVFRSRMLQLHTTRSWDFMGLSLHSQMEQPSSQMHLKYGDDVIVGILDTGVWPESESFRDDPHLGPVPSSWRGTCVGGQQFDPATACNRKLIGARYYLAGFEAETGLLNTSGGAEYRSARDRVGHGTHTASTAVGAVSPNASYFGGLGRGAARGGAPRARLAVYKVCWFKDLTGRCNDADILAAFDDALHDGVHVISASLGSPPPLSPLFATSTEVGSFHAMQLGVSTVFSAGNDGPDAAMVQNVSPWGVTVAASTIDRRFPTVIALGNNASFVGEGFIVKDMKTPLVESTSVFADGTCSLDQLVNRTAASGKIVLCFSTMGMVSGEGAALAVYAGGGSGVIFADSSSRRSNQDNFLPTVHVNLRQGTHILNYIQSRSRQRPTVHVSASRTVVGSTPAPAIAYFSSRGPSSISPNILKPDVTAPGVNILAAWPPKSSPTMLPLDKRSTEWNFDTGTSMSCPHVTGIVAILRSVHPTWSPAAVKSALMTTAYVHDDTSDAMLAGGTQKAADAFDTGAGHVDPLPALDPGLVYDADARDHVRFLCGLGYTEAQVRQMVLPSPALDTSCAGGAIGDADLNYPAIVLPELRVVVTVKRTVTNVGLQRETVYHATVISPQGTHVEVWPPALAFSPRCARAEYYVTVTPAKLSRGRYDFGEIVWSDGYHRVRTPLVVRVTNLPDAGVGAQPTNQHRDTTEY